MNVCVFAEHGLRSTSFVLVVAKKSEVHICFARTYLKYPSSLCQAGTRATVGDPLLSKLEVPAKTSKSGKITIVAGRRFWRFLLVNQLPLSIMAVHAQYRATAPLLVLTRQHFSKNPVVKLRQYHVFPANRTLVCAR